MTRNVRIAGGACLLALLAAVTQAASVRAQGPSSPNAALPDKIYTKSNAFDLPILMKDHAQQNLKEVVLFVKAPGAAWVRQDSAPPTASKFSYRAKEDGEYWFTLVTIDNQGRAAPPEVTSAPPGLRVVVDTKTPVIEVQSATAVDGECLLRCSVQDANLNTKSLAVIARSVSGEVAVEAQQGQPGVYRIRSEWMGAPVRITAVDRAGNTSTREINVKELVASLQPAPSSLPPSIAGTPNTPSTPNTTNVVAAKPAPTEAPAPPMLQPVSGSEKPSTPLTPPTAPPSLPASPVLPPVVEGSTKMPTLPIETATITSNPAVGSTASGKTALTRRIINTTHASVDYRIDQVGPSGVGKVEIYVSHDEGKSWHRAAEDVDRNSPAEVDLPGEGLFGVRLAITNGNGFGGTPPVPGATPHVWVEVDTTAPFVQLRPCEVVPHTGSLDIRWSASDPNLGSEPVAIYYRTRVEGPWQMIARSVKNDGSYRWAFPRDVGSQFFFKVEVVDMAGNVARAESQTPIVLDMTEPHASVVGVTGMSKGH